MATFEDLWLKRVQDAQELKLMVINNQAPLESFRQGVLNLYQLLSPTMANPEGMAYTDAEDSFRRMEDDIKSSREAIKKRAEQYDADLRDYKRLAEEGKSDFGHINDFLSVLIALGHKYNIFPRSGRLEMEGPSKDTDYSSVTD